MDSDDEILQAIGNLGSLIGFAQGIFCAADLPEGTLEILDEEGLLDKDAGQFTSNIIRRAIAELGKEQTLACLSTLTVLGVLRFDVLAFQECFEIEGNPNEVH